MNVNYKDITPINMIKKYGIKNIILSKDSLIFIIIVVMSCLLIEYLPFDGKLELTKEYAKLCVGISAGILAIVIAALAIIISMLNEEFMLLIDNANAYYDFVIPFYLSTINWSMSIIINIFLLAVSYCKLASFIYLKIIISISLGILLSGIIGLIDLVITSIGLGVYRIQSHSKKR